MRIRTFHAGEVTSRTIAPLHQYLVTEQSGDQMRNDPTHCLFTETKRHAGYAKLSTQPIPQAEVVDESFINYQNFTSLIDAKVTPERQDKTVTVVGAGMSGLCAAYELKRRGYEVNVLEATSRVGGRIITFRDPEFAPGIHAEGGAMRIPGDHYLLHRYLEIFGLNQHLIPFEMKNKFIHLSALPEGKRTMSYDEFNDKLIRENAELLALFPGLKPEERGRTIDQLFDAAVQPVKNLWLSTFIKHGGEPNDKPPYKVTALVAAYKAITAEYDKYTLRSYLAQVADWSEDAINLYDLGNAHVVFENGFIESFKDAFLSSNESGDKAGMQQLQSGMDAVPQAFALLSPGGAMSKDPLINCIKFGARVKQIEFTNANKVVCYYDNRANKEISVKSDYLILAIPYPAVRAIFKNRAFTPKQELAVRDVRYVEVTKILLQYKERWWTAQFEQQRQGTDGGVVSDLPIRYTMFPKEVDQNGKVVDQFKNTTRGVIMASYTFEQDATILGSLTPDRRAMLAAHNIDAMFPAANSLALLEAATAQVFSFDEVAGGSAFCYFRANQKSAYLTTMCKPDWDNRVFFAGEQASYSHGWIQGALEAALRCVIQILQG